VYLETAKEVLIPQEGKIDDCGPSERERKERDMWMNPLPGNVFL
jgi:hypothetical protein